MAILPIILIGAFAFQPVGTAITLLFLHNFVAFFYWYLSAKNSKGRAFVITAFSFLLAGLFLAGLIDANAERIDPYVTLLFGTEPSSLTRWATEAFLLTQGMHYFIWMKAIPDFRSTAPSPGGFALTSGRIQREFGKYAPGIVMIVILILVAISLGLNWETGRRFYVALAVFHGFYELAALIFPIRNL
jgi:hypothetical protein